MWLHTTHDLAPEMSAVLYCIARKLKSWYRRQSADSNTLGEGNAKAHMKWSASKRMHASSSVQECWSLTSVDQSGAQHISLGWCALDSLAYVMQTEVEGHIHQLLTHSCQMTDHLIAGGILLLVLLYSPSGLQ